MADTADHWWWRPGWRPGRRKYCWLVTFTAAPAVQAYAAAARARLAGLPAMSLVPGQWLMTLSMPDHPRDVSGAPKGRQQCLKLRQSLT